MSYRFLSFSLIAITASFSINAIAETLPVDKNARLTFGVNLQHRAQGYRQDRETTIMPLMLYDNNKLYVQGAEAGFYPYKDKENQLRIGINYDNRHFNNDNADEGYRQLDERKPAVFAHASYMRITPIGGIKIKANTSLTSSKKGNKASISYLSKFKKGKFTIYPEAGIIWYDSKYNNYYYGISSAEATRTGIAAYQAKSSISPFVSVNINYELNNKFDLVAGQRFEKLASAQHNSPFVKNKIASQTVVGLNYKF